MSGWLAGGSVDLVWELAGPGLIWDGLGRDDGGDLALLHIFHPPLGIKQSSQYVFFTW